MLRTDLTRETFWTRFTNFLTKTELRVKEVGLNAEAATPGKDAVGGLKSASM